MKRTRIVRPALGLAVLAGLGFSAVQTQNHWRPWLARYTQPAAAAPKRAEPAEPPPSDVKFAELSEQARKNLGLTTQIVTPQTYWKSIQIPGIIVDRPGTSDRGVTAPVSGVVAQVHALPGDTVRPGDLLFTLRLSSDYIQAAQTALFKAAKESELAQEERDRLAEVVANGNLPASKLIELDNQLRRQAAEIQSHRQDLIARGLTDEQVADAALGRFVTTIEVRTPKNLQSQQLQPVAYDPAAEEVTGPVFEVQELRAQLGQQVSVGELLASLSNHSELYIEGHAFKQDAAYLEQAAQAGWSLTVEFSDDMPERWPALQESFQIRHLANSIDSATRTFDFFVPLTNHSRAYRQGDQTFVVWRFRPGQRVRLHVPIEQLDNVLVLPSDAVAREAGEAYVFQQTAKLFKRLPVHVLHEDRLNVVIANDGSIPPRSYLAQGSAASLNRILKAQNSSGGLPPGFHVHADGSIHGAH